MMSACLNIIFGIGVFACGLVDALLYAVRHKNTKRRKWIKECLFVSRSLVRRRAPICLQKHFDLRWYFELNSSLTCCYSICGIWFVCIVLSITLDAAVQCSSRKRWAGLVFLFFGFWVVFQLNVSFLTRLCIAIHSLNQLCLQLENVLCLYPFNICDCFFAARLLLIVLHWISLSILLLFILFFSFSLVSYFVHTYSFASRRSVKTTTTT